ncbi:hypothetical protein TNCV_4823471 [Trichonephila clavipes]|nr:hypothetical protein TNCV_4823471 [Trichonephila clavipes]
MKEGLIASSYVCRKCGKPMELRERTGKSLNDGFEWLCRNRSSVKEENHVSRSESKLPPEGDARSGRCGPLPPASRCIVPPTSKLK